MVMAGFGCRGGAATAALVRSGSRRPQVGRRWVIFIYRSFEVGDYLRKPSG